MAASIPTITHEPFCMTVLGLLLSRRANAVSSLHGEVSRAMWKGLFPGKSEDAVPIGHITNGVHVPSWLAPQMSRLYDRHLGVGWQGKSSWLADLGENRECRRWRTLGNPPQPQVAAHRLCPPPRAGTGRTSWRAGGDSAPAGQSTLSGCVDHWLRAALCHLQASQPDPRRYPETGVDGQRSQASGAIPVCRQGSSPRRAGKDGAAADRAR